MLTSLLPRSDDIARYSDAALATMLLQGEGGYVCKDSAVVDPGNAAEVDRLLAIARELLARKAILAAQRQQLNDPRAVMDYLKLRLGKLNYEVFGVIFLDAKLRIIAYEEMFRGTLTQTSVYPREVVTAALGHGAAAVILAHNHPSGTSDPSRADEALTNALRSALTLVDVRVLDHFIVTERDCVSFAERGLL